MKTILGNNITKAIDHLNNGDVIAMPTETVYGFAANALNESAVKKIFELKKRPFSQAISIQISSLSEIKKLGSLNSLFFQGIPACSLTAQPDFGEM